MSAKTLDERARERKPQLPFGFASAHEHVMHRQRQEAAVIEDMLAEAEARLAALHQEATSS